MACMQLVQGNLKSPVFSDCFPKTPKFRTKLQQLQTPSGTYARHSGPGLLLRAFRTLFMRPGVSSPSLHIAPAPQSFYFLPALAKSQFSIGPWGVGTHTSLPRQACCYQCTSGLSTPGAGGAPPVLSSPVLRTHEHQGEQQRQPWVPSGLVRPPAFRTL